MTAPDPTPPGDLDPVVQDLLRRADELYHVGPELVRRAGEPTWSCARADRFREAMRARQQETTRLAVSLKELALWLRAADARAAELAAGTSGAAPTPEPSTP